MDDVIIKTGVLRTLNLDRGFCFVDVPGPKFPLDRYFLHFTDIMEGPNPPSIGDRVRFEVGKSRGKGKYPAALNAWILPEVQS
jgi:cold shock CspA family protein